MPQPVVGCDLSRPFIDLGLPPFAKVDRIPNTSDAISAFLDMIECKVLTYSRPPAAATAT